jgi:hypothetical protein
MVDVISDVLIDLDGELEEMKKGNAKIDNPGFVATASRSGVWVGAPKGESGGSASTQATALQLQVSIIAKATEQMAGIAEIRRLRNLEAECEATVSEEDAKIAERNARIAEQCAEMISLMRRIYCFRYSWSDTGSGSEFLDGPWS